MRIPKVQRILAGTAPVAFALLIIPLVLLPWLFTYAPRYVEQSIFRDAGMFQYMGWCLRHRVTLYDDVATPNGPLIYVIHALIQMVVGEGEHPFRAADLVLHLLGGVALGALLAAERGWLSRAIWASVGAALWLTYVFSLTWAETLQREIYFALLATLGLAVLYAEGRATTRAGRVALAVSGFLTTLVIFGKHNNIVYPALAVLAIYLADEPWRGARKLQLAWYSIGASVALVLMLGVIGFYGSFSSFSYWFFVYPLRVYRFVHVKTLSETIASLSAERGFAALPVTATAAGLFAIAFSLLPRAALALVSVPLLQLAGGVAQRKGWTYQFQPAIAGAHAVLLLGLARAWQLGVAASSKIGVWAAVAVASWHGIETLAQSPWRNAENPADASEEHIARREVSAFLLEHTRADARVFYYGIDPYMLYFAKRRPATPYIVSFELNFGPATSRRTADRGGPDAKQRAAIESLQKRVAADACSRLRATEPQAMIFHASEFNTGPDAVQDVVNLCPELRHELDTNYTLAKEFRGLRVYLRNP